MSRAHGRAAVVAVALGIGVIGCVGGPPTAMANGVAGTTISYCAGNACGDGGIDPTRRDYPAVELPISLTFDRPIAEVSASVRGPGGEGGIELLDEGGDVRITELPAGDWDLLAVFVRFAGGGDAFVVWALPEG